jgi:hypothetical protein
MLSRGEETHTKKSAECLRLRNHGIIFSSIDFKEEAK